MTLKPALSILLPHLRDTVNDRALKLCVQTLIENTGVDYELIIESVATRRDIYPVCNSMAERANADWIVFHNSDVFMAPGWAEPMLAAAQPDVIIAGVIVECGAIGVHTLNYPKNFGMTPETFDRAGFEAWVREVGESPAGDGWYFPSLHHRETFLSMGGFISQHGGFPTEATDANYWDRWRASGRTCQRVKSFCYHLQHYSSPVEQEKAVRQQ